jgi:CRISPR-associated endonuclease Csn1
MNAIPKISPRAGADLQLAFDVGHSSIGWAVLKKIGAQPSDIDILGCGSVVFRADDCLASSRRAYRRQRRHIRSTRQRIARMKILLRQIGVLTEVALDKPGCAWPWKLAAQVLQGGKLLTWPEFWDVLRWYAHNRGYDGNRRWSAAEAEAQNEDSEKEANARTLMGQFGTKSMAETFCAMSGINPLGQKKSANLPGDKRPKGQNAAFPREIVEREVRQILQKHFGKLNNVDTHLERALMGKDNNDKLAWQAIPCPDLKLPNRYEGGLLFGQLVPRFDNRIISLCPISGQKVPSRNCPEFLNFRWAMQLANIRVGKKLDRELRELTVAERVKLDRQMREQGYLTPGQLKDAVRSITACERDNLDTMLMHPDAKEALLVDPVQKLVSSDELQPFWKLFPERLQKRLRGQWRRGKSFSLAQIRTQFEALGDVGGFDAELSKQLDKQNSRVKNKDKQVTREALLQRHFPTRPLKLDGRAAYARPLLKQAYEEVIAGKPHPKETGGCLFISEEIRQKQLNETIAEQTNNHLVRHRLLILERVLADIVKEYAAGQKERIGKITIEVNHDLREMSGKTAKEKAQDMGLRLANHHAVAAKLEQAFAAEKDGKSIPITAGLIRKARIAEDLGWRCPYTGIQYEPKDLVTRRVDKDHVVPRSERASDSLDSLVITFSAINKWKGKRTAWQFVSEEQGKAVPDLPNLSILSLTRFKQFVENLESFRGHDDDKRRKRKRKELLLLPKYEEKEFTPRDLTQTSQLVRLGAQVLRKNLPHLTTGDVISLPGSVTGTVRKSWRVLGCLASANPHVLDENHEVKSKTDIRGITHLHHALDACVLGLSAHFIPNNGHVWELIVKRNLNNMEKQQLATLGVFGFNQENRFELRDLDDKFKEQIRQRLAEKRVVQHIPARMDGLRVEQNAWRVVAVKDGEVVLKQRIRQPDGSRSEKIAEEKPAKLLGLNPPDGKGKLAANKGALVIPDNFGVALDPQPTVIPFHKVWTRLKELKKANGGKLPRVLRNGQLIRVPRGSRAGIWRVMSTKSTEAYGLALDLALPDRVKLDRGNAPIEKLIQDGLEILDAGFTGIDSSGIAIVEAKKRPRKPKATGTDESCPTTSSA